MTNSMPIGSRCVRAKAYALICAVSLFAGCTTVSGVFEPDCIAFEGDRVEIAGGRFVWERFTDQVRVDAEGREIDPFPGYPKAGRIDTVLDRVDFHTDSGEPIASRYLLKRGSATYLLSKEQRDAVMSGGDMPDCALRRVRGRARN